MHVGMNVFVWIYLYEYICMSVYEYKRSVHLYMCEYIYMCVCV